MNFIGHNSWNVNPFFNAFKSSKRCFIMHLIFSIYSKYLNNKCLCQESPFIRYYRRIYFNDFRSLCLEQYSCAVILRTFCVRYIFKNLNYFFQLIFNSLPMYFLTFLVEMFCEKHAGKSKKRKKNV